MRVSEELLRGAATLVGQRLGLRIPDDRREDLGRALGELLPASPGGSAEAALAWLAAQPCGAALWGRLASRLTVGETYFFRDPALSEALEQHVLPSLIAARRSDGTRRLRIWSAGCATGEEPYSLAMLIDRLLPDLGEWSLTLLATDVNPAALEAAERGLYREWSLRETPRWAREACFRRRARDTFELEDRIRCMVAFAPLNLAEDVYPELVTNTSAMDVILCRNVLMYFTPEAQRETVARLGRALVQGGWLVASPAEGSLELFRPLNPVRLADAILYRKGPAFELAAPTPPPAWFPPDPPQAEPEPERMRPERVAENTGEAAFVGQSESQGPSLLDRARRLADEGRLEDARRFCQTALERDRLDAETHLLAAAVSQELGDITAALDALRRALYLSPGCAPAHFLQGVLLLRQGARRRGRRALENTVDLLAGLPGDEVLTVAGGLTAGRLKEMARSYLEG